MSEFEGSNRREGEDRRKNSFPLPEGWKIIDRRQTERREDGDQEEVIPDHSEENAE